MLKLHQEFIYHISIDLDIAVKVPLHLQNPSENFQNLTWAVIHKSQQQYFL